MTDAIVCNDCGEAETVDDDGGSELIVFDNDRPGPPTIDVCLQCLDARFTTTPVTPAGSEHAPQEKEAP